MTTLQTLGRWLSAQVAALRESPPLFGLVVDLWVALLTVGTAGTPFTAFLATAPLAGLVTYGAKHAVRRYRRPPTGRPSRETG